MSQRSLVFAWVACIASLAANQSVAAESIAAGSGPQWRPQHGWTPDRPATGFRLFDDGEWLVAEVQGRNAQMTWTLPPAVRQLAGEPRYLIFHYQLQDLDPSAPTTVLAARTEHPDWQTLVSSPKLVADGGSHAVAVDTESYRFDSPVGQFYLRTPPTTAAVGTMRLRIEWADEPPAGVPLVRRAWPAAPPHRIEPEKIAWRNSPEWTPRPPSAHWQRPTDVGVLFRMEGARRSMRWSARSPVEIDFRRTPYVTIRYRAKGEFGPWGYVFYFGTRSTDPKLRSVYLMQPGDVVGDGRWRLFTTRLESKEATGGSMAVGIDCLSDAAEVEIDYIELAATPAHKPIAESLDVVARGAAWPAGREGLSTVAPPAAARPNPLLWSRLGVGDWFVDREITVEGLPFRVVASAAEAPSTRTLDAETLSLDLSSKAAEVFVLLAASFPNQERFGASWERPSPLKRLDEPERASLALEYADGTIDELVPLCVGSKQYGIERGIVAYRLAADAARPLKRLLVHDRMRSGSFAVLGVTLNAGRPRFAEPVVHHLCYPPVSKPPAATADFVLSADKGIAWSAIRSPLLGKAESGLAGQPVFRLAVGPQTIASTDFVNGRAVVDGDAASYSATYRQGGVALDATVRVRRAAAADVEMSLELTNAGREAVIGGLEFPTAAGIVLGDKPDTWYFCARRGGTINRVETQFRDEIGEPHPLPVDGFFSPRLGAGISFQPRDLVGLFRWYRVGKDANGGNYSLEFLPQTVEAGKRWASVPVNVSVVPGDWRDQLQKIRRLEGQLVQAAGPAKGLVPRPAVVRLVRPVLPEDGFGRRAAGPVVACCPA